MSFDGLLKDLVEKIDAKGAILLDWEGESVAHYGKIGDYDLKIIGAYQVIILQHIRSTRSSDTVKFFQMKFDKAIAQLMPVSNEYFVLLFFENRETSSKAMYNLTRVVDLFAKEIA
jgi:hypothetical protein